jgi:fibronectin type 3 domain-containing protein
MDSNENLVGLISTSINSYSLSSSATVNDDKWHLGAITYNSATFKLYLDGEEVDSTSASVNLIDVTENLTIGKLSDSYPEIWDGIIDEVRICQGARYSEEIRHAYQMRKYHNNPPTWNFGPEDQRPTPPDTPNSLHASIGDQQVFLTWSDPIYNGGSPITGYIIYQGTTSGTLPEYRTIGNFISFNDINVTNGQIYYYQVAAVNALGPGPRTPEINATPATVPTPPLNLYAVAGDDHINLTWDPPAFDGGSPIVEYFIYKGESISTKTHEITVGGNDTTYNDSGLQNDKTYYYRGESDFSNEVEAFVLPHQVPMPPSNLSTVAEPGLINLTWEPAGTPYYAPVLNHTILRWHPGGSSEYYTTIGPDNYFEDTNVAGGITYVYSVQAINKYGVGNPSIESQIMAIGKPSPPSIYDVKISDGSVEILWNPPDDWGGLAEGGGYHVYRGDSPETLSEIQTGSSETSYIDGGLTNGQTYYYAVDARNNAGISPLSNIVNATPYGLPGAPLDPVATPGDNFINLSWSAPAYLGGYTSPPMYKVHRGDQDDNTQPFWDGIEDLWYNDTNANNGQTYYYTITCWTPYGESEKSLIVWAMPTGTGGPDDDIQPDDDTHGNWTFPVAWNYCEDPGFIQYELYVSYEDPNFQPVVSNLYIVIDDVYQTSYDVEVPAGYKNVYWILRTYTNNGYLDDQTGTGQYIGDNGKDDDGGGFFEAIDWWELCGILIGLGVVALGGAGGYIINRRRQRHFRKLMAELEMTYEEYKADKKKCKKKMIDIRKRFRKLVQEGKISENKYLIANERIKELIEELETVKSKKKKKKAKEEEEAPLEDSDAIEAEMSSGKIFEDQIVAKRTGQGVATAEPAIPIDDPSMTDLPPDMEGPHLLEEEDMGELPDIQEWKLDMDEEELVTKEKPLLALPPPQVFEANFIEGPEIDEIFVMTNEGLLLQHFRYIETTVIDEDILASMLTAITDFVKTSIQKKSALKELKFGDFIIFLTRGTYINVVTISSDPEVAQMEGEIKKMIADMEEINKAVLPDWSGDQSLIQGLGDCVGRLVGGEY